MPRKLIPNKGSDKDKRITKCATDLLKFLSKEKSCVLAVRRFALRLELGESTSFEISTEHLV